MLTTDDLIDDDAADTLRFRRPDFTIDAPTDPDATSIYDLTPHADACLSMPRRPARVSWRKFGPIEAET